MSETTPPDAQATPRGTRARNRTLERPTPDLWKPDELVTLDEACELFFPVGPLTTKSLRCAVRLRQLAAVSIAGKLFTTPSAVEDMITPRLPRDDAAHMMHCDSKHQNKSKIEINMELNECAFPVIQTSRGRKPRFGYLSKTSTTKNKN